MSKLLRYVVMSPESSQALAVARLLREGREDVRVVAGVVAGEPKLSSRDARWYHEIRQFSGWGEMEVDETTTVVPTGFASTEWLLRNYGPSLRLGTILMNEEVLRTQDKRFTLEAAESVQVPVPETWLDFATIPAGRPVFYKTCSEANRGSRSWSPDRSCLPAFVRSGEYLFQERIMGEGTIGFAFLAQKGEVLVSAQHHELLSMPRDGGSAVLIRRIAEPRVDELSRRLLAHLRYDGWGLVEYKYCPRRRDYVLMEINAKFWASLDFSMRMEPGFGRLLFACDFGRTLHSGQIWLDRAVGAGPSVLLQTIRLRRRSDRVIWEGAPLSALLRFLLPVAIRQRLRAIFRAVRERKSKVKPGV